MTRKEVTDINTDNGRSSTQLPNALALTDALRKELERTAEAIRAKAPEAERIALELTTLRNTVSSPLQAYPELPQLDDALAVALRKLPMLCLHAPLPEVMEDIRTLRRILLADRRHPDPIPQRRQLGVGVCIRDLWLIEHRSDLMNTRHELHEYEQRLPHVPKDHPMYAALNEHINVLRAYCETQELYCSSVKKEMLYMLNELRG